VLTLPSGTREARNAEYPALYLRFAELVRGGASEVDIAPLILVAQALQSGRTTRTKAFFD
jgi:D-galactose 1-dehydrogenase